MHRLCQKNSQALQDINLGDSTYDIGIILSEVDHKVANENQVFDQYDGALEAYKTSIQDNNKNSVCLHQEKKWSRKLDLQAAILTTKRVGKKFVLYRVEETWVVCLKNKTTLFKHVTLHDILDQLGATITEGKAINIIGLQKGMLS